MKRVFYIILTTDYVIRQPIPIEMWNKNFSGQGSFKGETNQIFDFVAVASIYPLDYGNIGLFSNVYLFLKRAKNTIFKINLGSQKWSLWVMLLVH